jgi:carbon-monoxide dehydrogenase medium subunit
MIPQEFEYTVPGTLDEALSLISEGAKPIAGGMSLVPLMKLRLSAPDHVVDIARIPGLNYIRAEADGIHIGATTTHYEIESSPVLRGKCPLLAEAASHIGDVQVRNMGTIGGSIAHADPAADYPAPLLALEAKVRLVSKSGERMVGMEEFLVDPFTTALDAGEIVLEVIVPAESSGAGTRYRKLAHPASGFAVVGVAVRVAMSDARVSFARIGVTGVAGKAFRAKEAEGLLASGASPADAAAAVTRGVDANSDLYASAEYRLHMTRVYAQRAITEALARTS